MTDVSGQSNASNPQMQHQVVRKLPPLLPSPPVWLKDSADFALASACERPFGLTPQSSSLGSAESQ